MSASFCDFVLAQLATLNGLGCQCMFDHANYHAAVFAPAVQQAARP